MPRHRTLTRLGGRTRDRAVERARQIVAIDGEFSMHRGGSLLNPSIAYETWGELNAERSNVVVFVHMGILTVGVRKKLGLPSKFDMSRSNPIDLHRVALEYPHVNFVIPHFGAGFFREALMLGDLVPNIYLDTSSTNGWIKYQLPKVSLADVFGKALEVFGPKRLLFGSDSSFFPRGWNREIFDVQKQALEQLDADEETVRAIFGGNMKRLLGK